MSLEVELGGVAVPYVNSSHKCNLVNSPNFVLACLQVFGSVETSRAEFHLRWT